MAFFAPQPRTSACSANTMAKKTRNVSELNSIVRHSPLPPSISVRTPISKCSDLLRNETDQKNDHRGAEQKNAHVREPVSEGESVNVVTEPEQEEDHTCRSKQ